MFVGHLARIKVQIAAREIKPIALPFEDTMLIKDLAATGRDVE